MSAHARRLAHPTVLAFAALALISIAYFGYLGRHGTFLHDEWAFITERTDLSLDTLLRPHNEHLSAGLVIVYRGLLDAFGLTSYVPYLAVVLALHVLAAAAVFASGSAKAGPWIGLGLASIALFLGAAWENLFWGFQIGFLASVASGAWALVALDGPATRRRGVMVGVLLTLSIAFSGMGLIFLAAAAALALYEREEALPAVAVPVILYAMWFAAYGVAAIAAQGERLGPGAFGQLPQWLAVSGPATVGRVLGAAPPLAAAVGLVALSAGAILLVVRRRGGGRVPGLVMACVAGVGVQLLLTGLVRVQFGHEFGAASRYLSSIGVLLLLATGALLARPTDRRLQVDRRVLASWAVAVAVIAGNLGQVMIGRDYIWTRAAETRTLVAQIARYIGTPGVDPDGPLHFHAAPRRMFEALEAYGSPIRDRFVPDPPPELSAALAERVLVYLVGPALAVRTSDPPTGLEIPVATIAHDQPGLIVAGGTEIRFVAPRDGEVRAYLAREADFGSESSLAIGTTAGTWYGLVAPDLRDGIPWRIRLEGRDRSGQTMTSTGGT